MRIALLFLLAAGEQAAPGDIARGAEQSSPASILPQFAFGGGWYSALYFSNTTSTAVSFSVNFISDSGAPLDVPSAGGSTARVDLPAHGTTMIAAANTGALVQGYAAFTLPTGVFGYGVFRQSVLGQIDQEAVVPLSDATATSSTLIWDENNLVTAVAIVNPGSTSVTVSIALQDETGTAIGTYALTLPPQGKTAATLRSLPGLGAMIGRRGSARFSVATGHVCVLGLRFDGLAFTSIPTTTGTPGSQSSLLSQFAFGGGWYSALYFTNTTAAAASFGVNFVSDAGTPLSVPAFPGATATINLPAYGTTMISASSTGGLVQGYAAFTLPPGVFGYGVFRQSVPGQVDQEAVVPLSDATASSTMLTWDESALTTAVAVVNPASTAASVGVTLWDESGSGLGTASIDLPAHGKTALTLRSLAGLSGVPGRRGSARFEPSSGSVAVLGLRFNGLAFTSIPTTGPLTGDSVVLAAERALAQTGLAIGQASTVLQSQFRIVEALLTANPACTALDGGGSIQMATGGTTVYYDAACKRPYLFANPRVTTPSTLVVVAAETATYYGLDGKAIGTMTLNETADLSRLNATQMHGTGVFTPAGGAQTPVQLGVYCTLNSTGVGQCAGAIAQDLPALGIAIGAVTPMTLAYNPDSANSPVTFTGGGSAVTGPLGSLTLTNPSPTSLVIQGGTPFATTNASGGAAGFVLFPPTPTSWKLTDSAHDEVFQISVVDNASRTLTLSITRVSTGATLATGSLDQSGSGTITWSDGSTTAVTNWTIAD